MLRYESEKIANSLDWWNRHHVQLFMPSEADDEATTLWVWGVFIGTMNIIWTQSINDRILKLFKCPLDISSVQQQKRRQKKIIIDTKPS